MTIGIALVLVVITGELAAKACAAYRRAPWCWCAHDAELHRHHRPGTDCAKCDCPRFRPPIIRRDPWTA
jgi:hypothetical protein